MMAVAAAAVTAINLAALGTSTASPLSSQVTSDAISYVQQAKLDGGGGRGFGFSVALEGDTAVIGEAGIDGDGTATVFTRTGDDWTLQTHLQNTGEEFGHAVDLSGDTALVGAPGFFDQANSAVGVFTRTAATWTREAVISTPDDPLDSLGTSLALSGDTAVVTIGDAPVVFVRTGDSWTEQARLPAFGGAPYITLGNAVAISGETVVVGASLADTTDGTDAGLARVHTRTGDAWTEQAVLTPSDAAPSGLFGSSVAISGDTAVVSGATSAYVFIRDGGTWAQQAELPLPGATTTDFVEIDVAIDGDTAVAGVPVENTASGAEGGAAYVFSREGTDWTRRATLTPNGEAAAASFGRSVAVSGDEALVGAYLDDSLSPNGGAVYVFVPSDEPPVPALSIDDVSVVEGDSGKRTARFTISRSGPATQIVGVRVATTNGGAKAPGDYVPRTTALTFAPGQTTVTFDVKVKGDTSPEADETFAVRLDQAQGATIADAVGTGTIENDD